MMANKKWLSIYIHIPFCIKKCLYCDFISGPATSEVQEACVDELVREIEKASSKYQDRIVRTVFFGGGTPSLLTCEQMTRIIGCLQKSYHMEQCEEITIEVNPATADENKLQCYWMLGINRLSIGLQSTHGYELELLGRIHTYEQFLMTYRQARKVGFANINIDLMAAIPSQTIDSYKETLERVCELHPEHISAYSLIIEEGTLFYDLYGEHLDTAMPHPITHTIEELLSEEEERQLYEMTECILGQHGYYRYEISNYAQVGNYCDSTQYECKHNNVYWQRGNYVGFGTSAASLVDSYRFRVGEEPVLLTRQEQMEEYMYLGLRRMQGVSRETFHSEFGIEIEEVYGPILTQLEENQLVLVSKEWVALTKKGIDLSNYVLAQFLL